MAQLKDLIVNGPSRFIGDVFANNLQAFRVTDNLIPIETNTYSLGSSDLKWKSLFIGTANTYGSASQPIWWNNGVPQAVTSYSGVAASADKLNTNAGNGTQPIYFFNGVPVVTTYALNATINSGATNRMAYYSGTNTISQASSIYASTNSMTINGTSAPAEISARTLKFQVNGAAAVTGDLLVGIPATTTTEQASGFGCVINKDTKIKGILNIEREGTTSDNVSTLINLRNYDSTTGKTSVSQIVAHNNHGTSSALSILVIHGNGNLIMGSGMSGNNLYAAKKSSWDNVAKEELFIVSDEVINVEANANNINNRIGFQITTAGHIIPVKAEAANTNVQNLGASNNKWANVYATNFVGNASSATKLATARNLAVALGSTTAVTFDGSANQNSIPVSGTLGIANGGTGATTAANARTNLGLGDIATYTAATAGTKDTWGKVPVIGGTDGVLEIGKYIDFHTTDGNTADYDARITAATTGLTLSGTTTGTFSGSLTGNASTATEFASAQSITLTGDTTGTASSQAGWSVATINVALSGLNSSWQPQSGLSSRPTTANVTFADNKIRYYLATSSMTEGKPGGDAHIIHMAWDNGKCDAQLSVGTSSLLQYRVQGNTDWTNSWITVLDTNNYTSYVPTKTGTGASGTWGISISGSAAKLGTTTVGSDTKPIYLNAGTATECSTYAGGTLVTLNGTQKGASTASFYAPTSGGTTGYILKSNGTSAPIWLQFLPVANGGTGLTTLATNKIYYASASTTLTASNHSINNTQMAINTTIQTGYALYVSGAFTATTLILPTTASTTQNAIWIGS